MKTCELTEKEKIAVQDILILELDVTREHITAESGIVADLGADSLSLVEIIMAVEQEFNVTVSDERAEAVRTVGDLYEAIAEEKTGAK